MSRCTVHVAENPLDPSSWEVLEGDDVREVLKERFGAWPSTARLYHEHLAMDRDVTPVDEAGVELLGKLDGRFYAVVYPAYGYEFVIYAIIVIFAIAAVAMMPTPVVPNSALRNSQAASPNNELAQRTNKPRVNGRIPDIVGQVRSTPDLIAAPYRVYRNSREVEVAYMAIGRGAYLVEDIRDDTTPLEDIAGAAVEIFGPDTSPNSGSPQLTVGDAIDLPLLTAKKANSVNGQVLAPPNFGTWDQEIKFTYPNIIQVPQGPGRANVMEMFVAGDTIGLIADLEISLGTPLYTGSQSAKFDVDGKIIFQTWNPTVQFAAGNTIQITAVYPTSFGDLVFTDTYVCGAVTSNSIELTVGTGDFASIDLYLSGAIETPYMSVLIVEPSAIAHIDLTGDYEVLSVTEGGGVGTITLDNPASVNAEWNELDALTSDTTNYVYGHSFATINTAWTGPFVLDLEGMDRVIFNAVALNGLFRDDGQEQYALDVELELSLTPVDDTNTPTGAEELFYLTLNGSSVGKSTIADTLIAEPTFTGRCLAKARRISNKDLGDGQVVDEVKWKDLYAAKGVDESHFGNVTTIFSLTYATDGALAIKDRKLNCLATRKLPARVSGSTFTSTLYATKNAADILSFVALDSKLGNRPASQIDFDNLYDTLGTAGSVATYFGTAKAVEFSYTFDNDNLSFEETATAIANACHCRAYRRGSVMKVFFEKETNDSVVLLNHRNKRPGTETRTVRFGKQDDYDGITFEYVDPKDDAVITLKLPDSSTPVNPKKVTSLGIRDHLQAWFHAQRAWNKLRYKHTTVEVDTSAEVDIVTVGERILLADNTRSDTQDGEVLSQTSLELALSQDAVLNKLARSEQLDNAAWAKFAMGVTADAAAGPKGNMVADKLVPTAGTATHSIAQGSRPTVLGAVQTLSVYLAPSGYKRAVVRLGDGNGLHWSQVAVDLSTGTVVNSGSLGTGVMAGYGCEDAGGGWWRVWVAGSVTSTSTDLHAMIVVIDDTATAPDPFNADGTKGLLVGGAQINMGPEPLPYRKTIDPNYTIHLQLKDGTVQALPIVSGATANKVILSGAPSTSLFLDDDGYARTTYAIVGTDTDRATAPFLLNEKTPNDDGSLSVVATNYDARFYGSDKDYINGVVDINGEVI